MKHYIKRGVCVRCGRPTSWLLLAVPCAGR
jgi:hypothetical protein